MHTLPILYSFRRCPFAIRARLAIAASGQSVELREIVLRDKAPEFLQTSPSATVPCLKTDAFVLDESLDIMLWALQQNDPHNWYTALTGDEIKSGMDLIRENDGEFKTWLDRYKYADRHPEYEEDYSRDQCGRFLSRLEKILQQQSGLVRAGPAFADVAIFPFVRQFSMVDQPWFEQCPYPAVRNWLGAFLDSPLFKRVMAKRVMAKRAAGH
ncbi:MAG: glutathione S-transferase [Rhodobacteraceae bacterium]|nr:glutathione S-transferase [Paracoccaceae bacterium]